MAAKLKKRRIWTASEVRDLKTAAKMAARGSKGALFRRASEEKVASVQRSFEKARRGKNLFGLEYAK